MHFKSTNFSGIFPKSSYFLSAPKSTEKSGFLLLHGHQKSRKNRTIESTSIGYTFEDFEPQGRSTSRTGSAGSAGRAGGRKKVASRDEKVASRDEKVESNNDYWVKTNGPETNHQEVEREQTCAT